MLCDTFDRLRDDNGYPSNGRGTQVVKSWLSSSRRLQERGACVQTERTLFWERLTNDSELDGFAPCTCNDLALLQRTRLLRTAAYTEQLRAIALTQRR